MTKNSRAIEIHRLAYPDHIGCKDSTNCLFFKGIEVALMKFEDYAKEEEKKWSALVDRQNEALKIAVKCNGLSERAEVKLAIVEEREACVSILSEHYWHTTGPGKMEFNNMLDDSIASIRARGDK